jgi:hypothetical protein
MASIVEYDEYTTKVRGSLATAWKFFERYKRPRTNSDWDALTIALGDYRDAFTSDLIVCVVDELEREYKHAMARKTSI